MILPDFDVVTAVDDLLRKCQFFQREALGVCVSSATINNRRSFFFDEENVAYPNMFLLKLAVHAYMPRENSLRAFFFDDFHFCAFLRLL